VYYQQKKIWQRSSCFAQAQLIFIKINKKKSLPKVDVLKLETKLKKWSVILIFVCKYC
jgi:hypothetical protein